ncbi:DNA cytosine methyltransferase, partial [Halorubrum sp. SP9]
TFPDWYRFDGGLVSVRKQIGNAVPPYLAESVGYYLKQSVYSQTLTDAERERIYKLRCGGMDLAEFEDEKADIGGHAQQVTLDFAN